MMLRDSLSESLVSACSLVALRHLCGCGRWMWSWQRRHSPPRPTRSAASDDPASRHGWPERTPVPATARFGLRHQQHPSPRRTDRWPDGGVGRGGRAGGPGRVHRHRPRRWPPPGIGGAPEHPTDVVVEHGSALREGAITPDQTAAPRSRCPCSAAGRFNGLQPARRPRTSRSVRLSLTPCGRRRHDQRGDSERLRRWGMQALLMASMCRA